MPRLTSQVALQVVDMTACGVMTSEGFQWRRVGDLKKNWCLYADINTNKLHKE